MSDSPPSSWYDPPEPKHDLEIKREQRNNGGICDRDKCVGEIYMDVEIGDTKYPNGTFIQVCKQHYDSLFEDTIDEIESYQPDYEDD